ncbi:MAG: LysR family transcriptional regulator [Oscillibacter ruminantium]|uniref:winged helix-turn-helix domain-containing protein n=1 Tax=Oscillibacter ruminantium TaxID=1263547 RepID=UPI002B20C208|nr:LysR family transcriptional regulator [Oscillibacter ruminantium]MEA5040979.1 LysR family transcriptional regulator [Oscillibacter ruminantium]
MCYHAGMKKKLQLKLTIRLYSDDDERCFGPGIAVLLHRVEEHHSLRAAAASMEMAYSKAWRIVRTAEAVFGCKLLDSATGGKNGGGAALTKEAKALLTDYDGYCAEVSAFASEKFKSYFEERKE